MAQINLFVLVLFSYTAMAQNNQNLSLSAGIKYGLDIEGRLSNDSYNFIKNDVVSQHNFGGYIDLRYRFGKRHNWHLKVGAEISRLSFYQRIIDERLSGQEYPAVKMSNTWAAVNFGIHKYFKLYDDHLFIDIGLEFQFRRYQNDDKNYIKNNFQIDSGSYLINNYELYVDYQLNTKIESFKLTPQVYLGLKYQINSVIFVNFGLQLSYPHFINTRYTHNIRYFDPAAGNSNLGYGYGTLQTNSAFTFLYISSGISMIIPRKNKTLVTDKL